MQPIGHEPCSGRALFVLDVARPEDVPAAMSVPGTAFVCLLAWDARELGAASVGAVAGRLLAAGCAYAVCWGPDCERVHDVFDEVNLAGRPDGPWAMTTWHSGESLSEAIWFALFCAYPDDAFAGECRSVVGVSVGSSEWAAQIRDAFADPAAFSARVLSDE